MDVKAALERLLTPADLTAAEMRALMEKVLSGAVTPVQTAALLVALRAKGESVDEIAAAAAVLRERAVRIEVDAEPLIDTCGTGGDGLDTFNVSTTAAFVVAAAGARVAKHGNRSVSSRCGSADVLEAAGVNLDLTPAQVKRGIETVGIGFLYAPQHHGTLRRVAPVRRELGVRTLFNLLGPLLNPAGAPYQLLGVFDGRYVEPLARVLGRLGSRHVLVVHADDGLDEISIAAPTQVAEWRDGHVSRYRIEPRRFGIEPVPLQRIQVDSVADSLALMRRVLAGEPGPAADIVVLNAGAALYAAGLAPDLDAGVEQARRVQRSGAGLRKLEELIRWSRHP